MILIHGADENASSSWHSLSPLLRNAGFNVFTFNHGRPSPSAPAGGLTSVASSAAELATEVSRVEALTGASRVDLVGHSLGGVVAQWYVNRLDGARHVRRLVALASPNSGIAAPSAQAAGALFGAPTIARELSQGSDLYRQLHRDGVTSPSVSYTFIGTRYDEVVVPNSSAYLPAAPNVTTIELQRRHPTDYADHFALPYDPYALSEVVHALDRRISWTIPEGIVPPYRGGYLPLS